MKIKQLHDTQCKIILYYFECNKIFGRENAVCSKKICEKLVTDYLKWFPDNFSRRSLKRRIHKINREYLLYLNLLRKIDYIFQSCNKGYYLSRYPYKEVKNEQKMFNG